MDPLITWAIILFLLAGVLGVAEIFVPSGGLLGIGAAACVLGGVVVCFMFDRWVGAGVSAGLLVLSPFLGMGAMWVWQRSPVGKAMTLSTTVGELSSPRVLIGAVGVTITELRPMGECEVSEVRIEAQSEMGQIIAPGRKIKVLAINGTVATVRELDEH